MFNSETTPQKSLNYNKMSGILMAKKNNVLSIKYIFHYTD